MKVLIDSVDTYQYLHTFTDTFPEELTLAEVIPLSKKAEYFDKVS